MAIDVKFLKGTEAAYQALTEKTAGTFYYTTDENNNVRLYFGEELLNDSAAIDDLIEKIGTIPAGKTVVGMIGDAEDEAEAFATGLVEALDGAGITGSGKFATLLTQTDGAVSATMVNLEVADIPTLTMAKISDAANVATSGAASDVSIADAEGKFDSDNVEGALAELAEASAGGVASKTVYMTSTGATADYANTYNLYQGAEGSTASPVASELVGTINIPKDMVATAGELVTVKADGHVYDQTGADITSRISSGAIIPTVSEDTLYIMLTIANGVEFFVAVQGLIDVYEGSGDVGTVTSGVSINVANGVISATIVTLDGTKLDAGSVALAKLDSSVQASLALADSAVQSVTTGTANGTISVDGTDVSVYGLGSAAYTPATDYATSAQGAKADTAVQPADLATVATTGDASDVAYKNDDSVTDALDDIYSQIGQGGSVEEQINNKIATLDATPSQTAGTDGLALSLTEVDGIVTAISGSIASNTYDAYGSASTAETNAKSYTDSEIADEVTRADSAYDAIGSASAVQANLETALTWGSF